MSFKAVNAVIEHSEAKAGGRLLMIMLADEADDAGISWAGLEHLAHKCRVDERTIRRQTEALVKAKRPELAVASRPGTSNFYRLLLPGLRPIDSKERQRLRAMKINLKDAEVARVLAISVDTLSTLGPPLSPDDMSGDPGHLQTEMSTDPARTPKQDPSTQDVEGAKRALSLQEQIADAELQTHVVPVLTSGRGYNAVNEFGKAFRAGWRRCVDEGLNPTHFGIRVIGHYAELLGLEVDPGKVGRLVGNFGIYALIGFEVAMSRDLDGDWLAYAWSVAKARKRDADAREEEAARA